MSINPVSLILLAGLVSFKLPIADAMKRKPKSLPAAATQATIEPLLELVIGEQNSQNLPVEHCALGVDKIEDLEQVQKLIEDASKEELQVALHIRATDPSFGYYAYAEGERIILRESHSNTQFRDGEASKQLIDLIDKHCQSEE